MNIMGFDKTAAKHSKRDAPRMAAALLLVGLVCANNAQAETLSEALGTAYTSNPTLEASRAQLRAVDEQVPQALSATRPTVQATGSYGPSWTESDLQYWQRSNPRSVGLEVSQPLYRGGRIESGIDRAELLVQAQRASLKNNEQTTLLTAATAYLDVIRDQAVLNLSNNNEQVLKRQLEAERDRFRVGEITKTDVSQSESRLARATADRITAIGSLNTSRAGYTRAIGHTPGKLTPPAVKFQIPSTLDDAIEEALAGNPAVQAANFTEAA
ncbi:exported hypothetical protein [Azospirillaceae bacterium]